MYTSVRTLPKKTIANTLRKSANILEEYGWCRGSFTDDVGQHCAVGAVRAAVVVSELTSAVGGGSVSNQILGALCASDSRIKKFGSVVLWNDQGDRTKEEVLSAFRKAASFMEHGGEFAKKVALSK